MINGMILILILLISHSLIAMSLGVPVMVYIISLNLLALPEHLRMLMTSIIEKNNCLNSLSKAYGIINSAKHFFKCYRRHFELIEKYSLKKLLQQGISNPEFYGDLVYKFKKIIGNPTFFDLFKGIVNRFKRAGYTLDIMRQTACLVLTHS